MPRHLDWRLPNAAIQPRIPTEERILTCMLLPLQRQELLAVDGTKQSSEGRATPARLLLLKEFASAALSDSQASAPIAASANANATDINYDQALLLTKLAAVTQCKVGQAMPARADTTLAACDSLLRHGN